MCSLDGRRGANTGIIPGKVKRARVEGAVIFLGAPSGWRASISLFSVTCTALMNPSNLQSASVINAGPLPLLKNPQQKS